MKKLGDIKTKENMNQYDSYNRYLWEQDAIQKQYESNKRFMSNSEAMKSALKQFGKL